MMILGTFVILIACVLEYTYVNGFYIREPGFSSFYEEPLRSASLTRSRLGLGRSFASFAPRSHHSDRRLGIRRGLGLSGLSSRVFSNSVYDRQSPSALYDTQVGNNGGTSKEVLGHSTRVRAPSHSTVRVSNLHRLHQASLLESPRQQQRVSTSKEVLGHVSTVRQPSRSFRQPSLIRRVHEPRYVMATVSASTKVHSGKTSKEVIGHSTNSASHLRLAGHTRVLQGELQPQPVDVDKVFGLLKKQQDLRKKQQDELQKHQYELQKQKHELLKKQQKELEKQQEQLLKQKYTSKELLGLW